MPKNRDQTSIQQMLEYSREAVHLINDKNREDICRERILSLALIRLLEIIGEAANRVSIETRTKYPDIPWISIINLRNRLIHGYDSVDFNILWQIMTKDLPDLITSLEKTHP